MEDRSSLTQEAASTMASLLPATSTNNSELYKPRYFIVESAKGRMNNIFHGNLKYMDLGLFQESMRDFKSEKPYMDRLLDYDQHDFSETRCEIMLTKLDTFEKCLLSYFIDKREDTILTSKNETKARYAGSVFKSWLSIFKKFYKHTSMGDLVKAIPLLQEKVVFWDSQHEASKAATFGKVSIELIHY